MLDKQSSLKDIAKTFATLIYSDVRKHIMENSEQYEDVEEHEDRDQSKHQNTKK